MTFERRLRQLATMLFGPIRPRDGLGARAINKVEKRLGLKLPPPLRAYYRLIGRHWQLGPRQDAYLLPAGKLYVHNGGLVFGEDEQGVCFTAVEVGRLRMKDPPVVLGTPEQDWWVEDGASLARYLLVMSCFHADLPAGGGCRVRAGQVAAIKARLYWTCMGRGETKYERTGLWAEGLAAVVEGSELYVGADSKTRLKEFGARFGLRLRSE